MSYGLKHELECTTKVNSRHYILRLLFDGYSSGEVDRDIPINPFALIKDKAAYVRGTSLEFKIREETDFEFLSFYSNNPKYIKAQLFADVIKTWTNYTSSFETFASSGRSITSAINATGDGIALAGESFEMRKGESINFKFSLTLNSGTAPRIYLINNGWTADVSAACSNGANDITLTPTWTGTTRVVIASFAAATNFSTGPVDCLLAIWSGYVNPNQYSVPYIASPVNVSFTASDGLGLLKQHDFTLTGNNSELTVIRHCIDKIDLGLYYAIAIDLYEVNHNQALAVLAQTYRDCTEFENKNCYEVLEMILDRYDAEISQCRNRWQIVRSTCKKSTRLIYNSSGTYQASEAAPTVINLGSVLGTGTEVRPVGNLWFDLEPGGKSVKIKHDYGRKMSMLSNYKFEKYNDSTYVFDDWTNNGGASPSQGEKDGKKFLYIGTYANNDTDYVSQAVTVKKVAPAPFVFEIDVCPVGHTFSSYTGASPVTMEVRMQVTLVVGSTTWYLGSTGWTNTAGYITQSITSAMFLRDIAWNHIRFITDSIPGDGVMTVKLQRYKNSGHPSGGTYGGVAFSEAGIYFLLANGTLYPEKSELTYTFTNSSEPEKLSDIELSSADAPGVDNAKLLYERITRLTAGGDCTTGWLIGSADTVYTALEALAKTLASNNRTARQRLKGVIRASRDLFFDDIIKHAYNSNREFEIAECRWDIYEETYDVTLLELLAYSDEQISVSDGTNINGSANLTVDSITVPSAEVPTEETFNVSIVVENSGTAAGRRRVEYELRLSSDDSVITSGTQLTAVIDGSDDQTITLTLTAPSTAADYYVAAKVETDSTWVESADFTVDDSVTPTLNYINTIADGQADDNMTVSFNASLVGSGVDRIYWRIRDSIGDTWQDGYQDIAFSSGSADYSLTGIRYPNTVANDWDLQIGQDGVNYTVTSNQFDTI